MATREQTHRFGSGNMFIWCSHPTQTSQKLAKLKLSQNFFNTEHQSPTILPMIKATINNNAITQTNVGESTTLPAAANGGLKFLLPLCVNFFTAKMLSLLLWHFRLVVVVTFFFCFFFAPAVVAASHISPLVDHLHEGASEFLF